MSEKQDDMFMGVTRCAHLLLNRLGGRGYIMVYRFVWGLIVMLLLTGGIGIGLSGCVCPEKPGPLGTDRPGQSTAPYVVPPCYPQAELGWSHTESGGTGEKEKTDVAPNTLVRLGLITDLELRLGYGGYTWQRVGGNSGSGSDSSGWSDPNVGFKFRFFEGTRWLPESAFVGTLSVPVGKNGFSSGRADPSFLFAFTNNLTDFLSFTYNLGAAWNTQEDEFSNRHTLSVFQYTASLGVGITENLGGFVEFYGNAGLSASKTPAYAFDTGLTYLVLKNLQLDVSGGAGLSDAADDWFVAAGISYRFPK